MLALVGHGLPTGIVVVSAKPHEVTLAEAVVSGLVGVTSACDTCDFAELLQRFFQISQDLRGDNIRVVQISII